MSDVRIPYGQSRGRRFESHLLHGTQQLLQTIGINGHPMRYEYDDADRLACSLMFQSTLVGVVVVQSLPGEELHQYKAQGTFDSPFRFNGKELDQETGLAYYGARYYDNKVGVWMSVDPLAAEYPRYSSYCFTANNPVVLIDPDGRWVPGLDDDGNVVYTAEKGDTYDTFKSQYGLTDEQASKMLDSSSKVIEGKTKVTGEQAKSATGNEILKLDITSDQATGSRVIDQTLFAMENSNSNEKHSYRMDEYFKNTDKKPKFGSNKYGDATWYEGYTKKINGSNEKVKIMIDFKNPHEINTQSTENSYNSHGDRFIFNYKVANGKAHPTWGVILQFRGSEQLMKDFIRKYNDNNFSGKRR